MLIDHVGDILFTDAGFWNNFLLLSWTKVWRLCKFVGLRDTGEESNEAVPLTTFDLVTLFVLATLLSESEAFDDKFVVLEEDSFCKTKSDPEKRAYPVNLI